METHEGQLAGGHTQGLQGGLVPREPSPPSNSSSSCVALRLKEDARLALRIAKIVKKVAFIVLIDE